MPKKAKQKLTERQSDWLAKTKACEASGKSVKAFAESEGLRLQDLYSWKKKLVKKGVLPRTVSIQPTTALTQPKLWGVF